MYNKDRKIRYLNEIEKEHSDEYVTNYESLFNKTEKYEEMFGKDVCDFSREDIGNMYSLIGYSDSYTYSNVNSRLSTYTIWCMRESLVTDGCNHFQEVVFSDFDKYINRRLEGAKFLTREQALSFCRNIQNPRDAFVILCLFEFGKSQNYDDIFLMKPEDIDVNNHTIKLNSGRVVKVSSELINVAFEAFEEEKYYFVISGQTRNFVDNGYIFKNIKINKDPSGDSVNKGNKAISRIIKNYLDLLGENRKISAASLAISGQMDMIARRSAELNISKKDYIYNYFDEIGQQYIMSPGTPFLYYTKYQAYL